jgi:predicted transglutaminase-like cysteine proteinase
MLSLRPILIRGAALSIEDKLRLANRYINKRHYRNDRDWKTTVSISTIQRNQWRSLLEFLEKGGDCEDYATAKYFLLRSLGVPADDLRVVVAWDRKARGYHALLAYRASPSAWLLDTDGTIKRGVQQRIFRFLFSLNELGIWDHGIKPKHG